MSKRHHRRSHPRRSSGPTEPPPPFVAIMHGRWPIQFVPATAAGWRWFLLRMGLFVAVIIALTCGADATGIDPDRNAGVFIALELGLSALFLAYLIPAMLHQSQRIDVRGRDLG